MLPKLDTAILRLVFGTMTLLTTAGSLPALAQRTSQAKIIRADQLTKREFDRQLKMLPENAVIESNGQRMTKAQMRKEAARQGTETVSKAQARDRDVQAKYRAWHAQFEQEQQAKLKAENANLQRELAQLIQTSAPVRSPKLEIIQQEATQLLQRSKTAPPAEREQIEKRAQELLRELQQSDR